mmetsp:Transcript_53240/g.171751  ORF Transcript_53240/g.171751 Transcript_53240/m.171751 type:complete len:253 (+) Transcript_53240:110-868(+)
MGPLHDQLLVEVSAMASTGQLVSELQELRSELVGALRCGIFVVVLKLLRRRIKLYRANGLFDGALADAEVVVQLAPTDMAARFWRGVSRLEAGGRDCEALADLRVAWRRQLVAADADLPDVGPWLRRVQHWLGLPAPRPNHYGTLGVTIDAPADSIRQAFRRAALRWHPDKLGGDAERFREVQEAWEVLSDADRRLTYDVGDQTTQVELWPHYPSPCPPPAASGGQPCAEATDLTKQRTPMSYGAGCGGLGA